MGIEVEDKWRYKKVRSETASKSAFAYKINSKLKGKDKIKYGYAVNSSGSSREVIVKITGGAKSKKGIKNAVEYISHEWQEEIIDSNGIRYKTKEEMESAVKILQENVVYDSISDLTKEKKLTHNITFSAPKIAGVKKEEAIESVRQALSKKYPDNYFVLAYHEGTTNPHVHAVLNIHKDTGERIDIRKKDLRDIREGFCNKLVGYGYNVQATRKYGIKTEKYKELLTRENRNVYKVIDFGSNTYDLNQKNSKNNYLVYRTSAGEEVTIWGKEIIGEIEQKNVKTGDSISIKKVGEIAVKVPVYADDGETIISWKDTKRNQWSIENLSNNSVKAEQKSFKAIKLDSPEQAEKQLAQRQKFEQEKKLYLDPSYKEKFGLERKIQQEQKYKFTY